MPPVILTQGPRSASIKQEGRSWVVRVAGNVHRFPRYRAAEEYAKRMIRQTLCPR